MPGFAGTAWRAAHSAAAARERCCVGLRAQPLSNGHDELPPGVPSCSVEASTGGPMPSPDEIRDVQRATWAGLSAGREMWASVVLDQLGPVGAALIGQPN